ncbi:MAG: phosphatidate cytidylyltransferase [Acutalibacteraceae bacterium]
MKTRIISAAVGIPVVIALLVLSQFTSPLILIFLLSILSAFMVGELLYAKGLLEDFRISLFAITFGFTLPLFSFTKFAFLPLYIYILILLFVMIFFHKGVKFEDISYCITGPLIVALGIGSITYMAGKYPDYLSFYFTLALATPWVSDGGAYFVGVFFGKHKLCPEISPKKTVEGALGGLLSGVLSTLIIGLVFNFIFFRGTTINYWSLLIIGLINTPLSMIGDLSFSAIKRSLGVKDFGKIIPGHGGVADRFDSVVVTAPVILVVSLFTTIIK